MWNIPDKKKEDSLQDQILSIKFHLFVKYS